MPSSITIKKNKKMVTKTKTKIYSATNKPRTIGELNTRPSETTPDMALSINDILTRFTRGTLPPIGLNGGEFSGDNPDIRGLDISQIDEIRSENQALIQEYENKQKAIREAKEKADLAELEELRQYRLANQEPKTE